MQHKRPSKDEMIFADGSKPVRPLALHPDAIGVSFKQRPAADVCRVVDGIAVLCVDGPLEHKGGGGWWCFWQTYEDLAARFQSCLLDSAVRAVVLKFDSPGGEVSGLTETVRLMQAAKESSGKRVLAYVDEDCYSAAYALAMVADEIYLPEAGNVGSIGVITAMVDVTAMDKKDGVRVEVIASGSKKADGHPHVPLSSKAIERTQKRVAKLADAFFALVSEGRGLSVEEIAGMQAGTFSGSDAVDAGLADGVMTLAECLTLAADVFGSTEKPTDQSAGKEKTTMGAVLAATRSLNEANAALAAAKTDKERARCVALVTTAEQNLAAAHAGEKPGAKVKKTKTVTTDTHEEEVDDGEEDDDDDDDSSTGASDDGDDDDDDDAESARHAGDNATTGLHTKDRLLRHCRQITGKKSIAEVMGALQGMWEGHKRTTKLAQKVERLEADAKSTKLSALISKGIKAGQLAPTQKRWALTQTPESLKAYLDTAPNMVHTIEDGHAESKVTGAELGAITPEMARIWRKQGFAEKDFPGLLAKLQNSAPRADGAN